MAWGARMTYWLGIDSPEVWADWAAHNPNYGLNEPVEPVRFGFRERRRKSVQQIQPGDRIINYMTKGCWLFAVWEVTEKYVYDPNYILAGEVFSECVWTKPIVMLLPERGIRRRQDNNWGVPSVRMAAVRLDDDAGDKILSVLRQKKAESPSSSR